MTSAADWSGRVGNVWAAEWRRTDRSFAGLSNRLDAVIREAALRDTVALDIGCGAGGTSLALATARPDATVTGIDLSAELIAIAQERGAQVPNARFAIADAATLPPRGVGSPELGAPHSIRSRVVRVEEERNSGTRIEPHATADPARHRTHRLPDLLVSRHGVMFFADPVVAFARLSAAAAPDAALVFSCFRDPSLNPWASDLVAEVVGTRPERPTPGAPGPFAFADRDAVAELLRRSGWRDATAEAVDFRYVAGAGDDPVGDALSFFRRIGPIASALRQVPDAARPAMLDKLAAALQNARVGTEVAFPGAAWIWRARS